MPSPPQSDLAPAKIITPAVRQRLQERLTQARKLSVAQPCPHGQIDELLCECVIVDPGNTVYIGALLHHLRRSDRPRRTGFQPVLSFFSRFTGGDVVRPVRRAAETRDWNKVLTLAPPALCRQPQSVEIPRHLAAACAALEYEQAELCYLQAAAALAPDDAETQRQLARALTRQGLFDEAAVAWKRLRELLPDDEECGQSIKILCEYEPPKERTGVLPADEVCQIQNVVEAGTATVDQVRQLFDHLRGLRKFDDAEDLLDHATALLGPNLSLLECREQLAIDRSDHPMYLAWALAPLRAEYKQCVDRATSQSVRTRLQVQYQRSERHRDDPGVQLHLGQLLYFSGNTSAAIQRLDEVAGVPQFRARALQYLACAWQRLKHAEKAMSCYQESIVIALDQGDEDTAACSLQFAALLAADLQNVDLACELCTRLLSLPCSNGERRLQQDFARRMLDNLGRVCHNP